MNKDLHSRKSDQFFIKKRLLLKKQQFFFVNFETMKIETQKIFEMH